MPKIFDGYEVPRCPMHYISNRDPWRDRVIELYHDLNDGVIKGWPDRFAASAVQAVRFLKAEIKASEAAVMERAYER